MAKQENPPKLREELKNEKLLKQIDAVGKEIEEQEKAYAMDKKEKRDAKKEKTVTAVNNFMNSVLENQGKKEKRGGKLKEMVLEEENEKNIKLEENSEIKEQKIEKTETPSTKEKNKEVLKQLFELEGKGKEEEIKKEIFENADKKEQEIKDAEGKKIIASAMKTFGLSEKMLEGNENLDNLTKAQKLLAIEQISQDTLSRVRDIGEERFKKNNKIALSDIAHPSIFFSKIGKNIVKPYFINKESKKVLKETQNGNPPDQKIVEDAINKITAMKLEVVEKDGRAHVILEDVDNTMSPEEKDIVNKYNEIANEFIRMPDKWRNEKAAKAAGNGFVNKNYKKFKESQDKYEKARDELLKLKAQKYKESGAKEDIAGALAMNDLKNHDWDILTLQLLNTNPNLAKELNEIQNSDSFKQFMKSLNDSDTVWKGIYLAGGFIGRGAAKAVFGAIALPAVAAIKGGLRAKNKAKSNINTAFLEGRNEKTFMERKQGEKGNTSREELVDKNLEKGMVSKIFSGTEINTKDVAGFIDADSQIQRIEKLQIDLENVKTPQESAIIIAQINARVDYIRQKQEEGLINSGKENAVATNYKLIQKMSEVSLVCEINKVEGYKNNPDLADLDLRRQVLLDKIMEENEKKFGKKEASYKWKEFMRGAVIAGSFAETGLQLRDLYSGSVMQEHINEAASKTTNYLSAKIGSGIEYLRGLGIQGEQIKDSINTNELGENISNNDQIHDNITGQSLHHTNEIPEGTRESFIPQTEKIASIDIIEAKHGDGGIVMARHLQKQLLNKYPNWETDKTTPDGVKNALGMKDYELAKKWGLYKPEETAESAIVKIGDKGIFDEETGKFTLVDKNGVTSSGKMFDYHSYGVKAEQEIPNYEPEMKDLKGLHFERDENNNFILEKDIPYEPTNNQISSEYEPVINQGDVRIDSKGIKHINFHNEDNYLLIKKGGKEFDMKFFYDKNGNVNDIKITNTVAGNEYPYSSEEAKSYFKKFKLDNISYDEKIKIADKVGEVISNKELLKNLPRDTQEYKFFEQEIMKKEKGILDEYGKFLKARKFGRIEINEVANEIKPESITKMKIVSEDNINKIFPNEKLMTEWNSMKKHTSVEDLIKQNEKGELSDNAKPLITYLNRLQEVTNLKPESRDDLYPSEKVGDYIDRALKEAAKTGKLDQVKL